MTYFLRPRTNTLRFPARIYQPIVKLRSGQVNSQSIGGRMHALRLLAKVVLLSEHVDLTQPHIPV